MKLVNLIPLSEIDFPNQRAFDDYNKIHKLRPDTDVTVAGRKTTAGRASQNSTIVKGTNVFDKTKDKEQKKAFKDLGLNRDKAINAHVDAQKYAKSKGKEPAILPSDFTQFLIKTFRKEKMKIDDTTAKFLSKLSKSTDGEMVADTDTGNIQFFLYNGSRYEMNIDTKNKSVTTKSKDDIHPKLKDLYKQQFGKKDEPKPKDLESSVENHLNKVSGGNGYAQKNDGSGAIIYNMGDGDMPTYTLYMGKEGSKHRVSLEPTYGNDPKKLQGKIDKSFDKVQDAIKFMGDVAKKHRRELEMQDK